MLLSEGFRFSILDSGGCSRGNLHPAPYAICLHLAYLGFGDRFPHPPGAIVFCVCGVCVFVGCL